MVLPNKSIKLLFLFFLSYFEKEAKYEGYVKRNFPILFSSVQHGLLMYYHTSLERWILSLFFNIITFSVNTFFEPLNPVLVARREELHRQPVKVVGDSCFHFLVTAEFHSA